GPQRWHSQKACWPPIFHASVKIAITAIIQTSLNTIYYKNKAKQIIRPRFKVEDCSGSACFHLCTGFFIATTRALAPLPAPRKSEAITMTATNDRSAIITAAV
ncbi:MAG: hypothetical protein ACTHXI_07915, partial [Halomonadaceae bacterium]